MKGHTHRALAAVTWLAAAAPLGVTDWRITLPAVAPAVAFSAGPTSPDADNSRLAKKIDGFIPGPDPFGHRRLAHWWGIPAAAGTAVWHLPDGVPRTLLFAAVVGWASHLLGDAVFGRRGMGTPRGIPLAPWWWHVGVGIKVGSWPERTTATLLIGAFIVQVSAITGATGRLAPIVDAGLRAIGHQQQ